MHYSISTLLTCLWVSGNHLSLHGIKHRVTAVSTRTELLHIHQYYTCSIINNSYVLIVTDYVYVSCAINCVYMYNTICYSRKTNQDVTEKV